MIIWSHGGEDRSEAANALEEWSRWTAQAGYLTVTPAHRSRTALEQDAYCAGLGIPMADCAASSALSWDRPNDIIAVINEVEQMAMQGSFAGRIDRNKVAVGGWSAGSTGPLSVAGATRFFTSTMVASFLDPRVVAFVILSPSGPGAIGFFDTDFQQPTTSWDWIQRPVLVASGEGDTKKCMNSHDCFQTPSRRRIAFERMPAGIKHLMYINDIETTHDAFSLDVADCVSKGCFCGQVHGVPRLAAIGGGGVSGRLCRRKRDRVLLAAHAADRDRELRRGGVDQRGARKPRVGPGG